MPDITVNVEVYCARCGEGLCGQTDSIRGYNRGEPQFRVEPCEKCLDVAKDVGDDEGYSRGYDEGYAEGGDKPEVEV